MLGPKKRYYVRGGFFWIPSRSVNPDDDPEDIGASIRLDGNWPIDVEDNVLMCRPRWWQVRQWAQALRWFFAAKRPR